MFVSLAVVVVAPLSPDGRELTHANTIRATLERRHEVATIELTDVTPMSRSERLAYETPSPILDLTVAAHAEVISMAEVLVFVFPVRWWTPPPAMTAWLERVFVPGVAFVLHGGRVRPNLGRLRAIAGVVTHSRPDAAAAVGDGARRMVLRTLRLNAPGRVRTAWFVDPERTALERGMRSL